MGSSTFTFPLIDATVVIDWNDVNLRLGYVTWVVNATCQIRVTVYRINISPDPVYDEIIQCPASGDEPVPGNLRMEEYEDSEYPEEGVRLRWPDGLVFNISVLS